MASKSSKWVTWFALSTLASCVAAQVSSDFNNDLITDLGPLLSLFGDNMTRQYLSESLTSLDYLIFCLAPIGILTCIVSVIRVCGSPALNAFIGRAQEARGTVEAELCTSTSRDVCELFNAGGITRVFGRPKILEVLHSQQPNGQWELSIFRDHLNEKISNSRKDEVRQSECNQNNSEKNWEFPPNPNVTLNVGTERPAPCVFRSVALLGLLIQAGIIAMAGVGTFCYKWTKNEVEPGGDPGPDYIPERHAAILFIVGTISMSSGMYWCARLIGESTKEMILWRDTNSKDSETADRLFWLQPGGQVIGDQTFDAFAYSEGGSHRRLSQYISSKQAYEHQIPFFQTNAAIMLTLIGYVAQFIGLRGLNVWISLAQLLATILMSLIRGVLRKRKLRREDNELHKTPDLVLGHEFDWLALRLRRFCKEHPSQTSRNWPDLAKSPSWYFNGVFTKAYHEIEDPKCSCIATVFEYRQTLAKLTSHDSARTAGDSSFWEDNMVAARAKSKQLAKALCCAAEILLVGKDGREDLVVDVPISTTCDGSTVAGQVSIVIGAPNLEKGGGWSTD